MNELTSEDAWDACLAASEETPVFVFKHSTACPVSSQAHNEVARYVQAASENDPPVYMVKVIEARPVSSAIAADLAVEHRSPQLILVDNKTAAWTASHYGINLENIQEATNGA